MKEYKSLFKRKLIEGVGYELYSKGVDRVSKQCETISNAAKKVATSTRANDPIKKRKKLVKDLQKWVDVLNGEMKGIVSDVDNLEGYKEK